MAIVTALILQVYTFSIEGVTRAASMIVTLGCGINYDYSGCGDFCRSPFASVAFSPDNAADLQTVLDMRDYVRSKFLAVALDPANNLPPVIDCNQYQCEHPPCVTFNTTDYVQNQMFRVFNTTG